MCERDRLDENNGIVSEKPLLSTSENSAVHLSSRIRESLSFVFSHKTFSQSLASTDFYLHESVVAVEKTKILSHLHTEEISLEAQFVLICCLRYPFRASIHFCAEFYPIAYNIETYWPVSITWSDQTYKDHVNGSESDIIVTGSHGEIIKCIMVFTVLEGRLKCVCLRTTADNIFYEIESLSATWKRENLTIDWLSVIIEPTSCGTHLIFLLLWIVSVLVNGSWEENGSREVQHNDDKIFYRASGWGPGQSVLLRYAPELRYISDQSA